jgi:prepilin-type N-terminal cleavage/methylation domain-containing protein
MNAKGFTLIELLVVISIIAILASIGSFGISNFSKSRGVSMATSEAAGIFQLARIEAKARPTYVRVLIHAENDPDNMLHRERYLRYMVIQSLNKGPNEKRDTQITDEDAQGDDFWEITKKGHSLAKNAWFIPSLSNQTDLTIPTISARLPAQADGETSNCYYYLFNQQGIMVNPKPATIAPRFVIGSGSMPPGNAEPIRKNNNVGGFVIWRNGATSTIKHPEQVGL